jgi:hypothetical protein
MGDAWLEGDLLLVRREQALRSTAARRSRAPASRGLRVAAALCCGLPLPSRFQMRFGWRGWGAECDHPNREADSAGRDLGVAVALRDPDLTGSAMQGLAVLDLRVHGDCDAAQKQCHDDDPDRGQHPSTPTYLAGGS